jgi:tetratricopeptide (TPR) repeat protein
MAMHCGNYSFPRQVPCVKMMAMRISRIATTALLLSLVMTGCASHTEEEGSYTAMSLLESGDYAAAVESLEGQTKTSPDKEATFRSLGIAYMGLGQYDQAAAALEQALQHAGAIPGSMEYDINDYLGTCYYKLGEYEKAQGVYDAICTLRPRDAAAYVSRGTVRIAMDDTDGMDEDFQKAIALDPDNYDRIIEIFKKTDENGCTEIGKGYLEKVLKDNADTLDNYNKGRLSYYAGDYETAKSCLEQTENQKDYNVVILLGRTYEALGDYNYATSVYQTFLESDTSHAEVYNQLGMCELAMGDYQSALSAFESGLSVENNDVKQSLSFNEIVAYEYLGEFQKASVLMDEYLKNYPGDESAKRESVFLSSRSSKAQDT